MITTHPSRTSVLAALRRLSPTRRLDLAEALQVAERQAARLLDLTAVSAMPVPLTLLATLPRIELATERDLPTSGASYWTGDAWRLVAVDHEHPNRQRFTLFHEYKHVIDHPIRALLSTSVFERERVADFFAACVLMPRRHVTQAWCAGEQDIAQLADYFAVSPIAMERRLRDLGHLTGWVRPAATCSRRLAARPLILGGRK